nr:leucine-rich repeat domain-containing protein [Eubacterium sp.]
WAGSETNKLHSVFIVEYKGSAKEVEFPAPQALTYNGKTYAPEGAEFMIGSPMTPKTVFPSNQVTKLAIPDGYTMIMESAFLDCTSLTEIAIAESVLNIGGDAFAGCTNLTTYYLAPNVPMVIGGTGDPKIAQNASGEMNAKQVTVYAKEDNTIIKTYIETVNNKYGEPKIILKTVADPYSLSTVPPGSGAEAPAEQKGKDGTALGEGASEKTAESFLVKYAAETDPTGTVFSALQLKPAKVTKSSVKLTWKKPKGAVRFIVYGNKCGKGNKYVKQAKTTAASIVVKKIGKNKVKKGTYYKFIVVAFDAKDNVVSTSKTVHVATAGGTVGNAKAVTTNAKKDAVNLKAKKTFTLKAKAVPASKKLKVRKHRVILFESSNKKIATVSKKGVIKGLKKGTCYVYAYAQNGVCKKIKVKVN